jgi:pimeloyl-ACP methyl ester carboxylesterase
MLGSRGGLTGWMLAAALWLPPVPPATPRVGDDAPRLVELSPAEQIAITVQGPAPSDARRPAVVLLPGVLGSAFSMRHVASALVADGHPVVIIDPLGMGSSSRPLNADYSLHAQAVRLLQVLDRLGWADVVIAGHGTSATIALRAAGLAATRVRGVVSIAGGPVEDQQTDGVESALRFAPLLRTPMGRAVARRRFAASMRDRSASSEWLTADVLREYMRPLELDLAGTLRVLRAMGKASEPISLISALASVQAPVTLLEGGVASSGTVTDAQRALLREQVADLQVTKVAGAGAMLHEERPESVVRAIADITRREVPPRRIGPVGATR